MARLLFYRNRYSKDEAPVFIYRLREGRNRIGRVDDCDVVLPDTGISRSHALVDLVGENWQVTDRSSNGTFLNDQRLGLPVLLSQGDQLRLGSFVAVVDLTREQAAPTEESQPEARHEEILEAHDGLTLSHAFLVIRSGPGEGERFRLKGGKISVGGFGSRIVLPDPTLVRDHVRIRLYEGRSMVEPGAGAAWLGHARIRDILPLTQHDEVRIGSTEFSVLWDTELEEPVSDRFGDMVGRTVAMQKVFGMLRKMAPHHAPVLLLGASGTGKELAARGIHDASPRSGRPFVAINCGAITANLFESELFGYEKGAFTGANERRDGAFHRADGGTLFLDEVGELPENAQAKLLRVLESGEVRRVGGTEPSFPDVRVVAATNRNLAGDAQKGSFRQDLYFRLAVLSVTLPSLRERAEDVPTIAETLARRIHPAVRITPEAMAVLQAYRWPGNVRELRNVLTRAYVMGGPLIEPDALEFQAQEAPISSSKNQLEEAEREVVEDAMRRCGKNKSQVARMLGIPRTTLVYKLQRWGLED